MNTIFLVFAILTLMNLPGSINAKGAGECAMLCNDLRFEVLTLSICKDAKKILPRPKVGDFCSTAMEQGFSDACVSLCMGEKPIVRVAQTCRAAAIEMPRPTVRRWCEHGYNMAFQKAVVELKGHFKAEAPSVLEPETSIQQEPIVEEKIEEPKPEPVIVKPAPIEEKKFFRGQKEEASVEDSPEAENETEETNIKAIIPITLENDETKDLIVYKDQNPEDAVASFCSENVPDDVSSCIRYLYYDTI